MFIIYACQFIDSLVTGGITFHCFQAVICVCALFFVGYFALFVSFLM